MLDRVSSLLAHLDVGRLSPQHRPVAENFMKGLLAALYSVIVHNKCFVCIYGYAEVME